MTQSNDYNLLHQLMIQSDDTSNAITQWPKVIKQVMAHSDDTKWWNNLKRQSDDTKWFHKVMKKVDEKMMTKSGYKN